MPLARADLESLLQARKLDRTLTTALPPLDHNDEYAVSSSGVTALDARLGGGFPRGQLSELIGPRSSGRTSVVLQLMAAATARGELVALVDALDMFDVSSAEAAGVALDRLLWIRGHVVSNPGLCRDTNARALDHALKALTLVLQAGTFGLVVFDAAEAPLDATGRLPFTTWLRLQRIIEGSQTACVLMGTDTMARSSAGLTMQLGMTNSELGIRFHGRLLDGLDVEARIVRARWQERVSGAVTPPRHSVPDTPDRSADGSSERDGAGHSVPDTPESQPRVGVRRGGGAPQRHSVLDTREGNGLGVPSGEGPLRHPVLDTREDDGPSASGSGGGAPRRVNDVRVHLSTTCV